MRRGSPCIRRVLLADPPVCDVKDGVRKIRELDCRLRKNRKTQDIAEGDAQQLPPPKRRQIERRGHAGRNRAVQLARVIVYRKRAF